ncbi:MAG: hypothetical protein LBU94_03055, partial [Clostridiales bacterium]|nr:hypothetical protein [Clostridiales bacterium]
MQIIKIDNETKEPLKGAKFTVYEMNGEVVGHYETDGDGLIIIDNLSPHWYKLVETKAPSGYQLDDTPKDIEITHDQFLKITLENKKLTSLVIHKVDDKSGEPLAGALFTVEKQNGEHVGQYSTDSDGLINIPTLTPDWYIIREKRSPDGYLLDESPKTVEVKTNVPTVVTFTNKKLTALEIIKVDEDTNEPLNGAVFAVEKQNGERIGEYTTADRGIISIPTLEPDFYVVKEIRAVDGYFLDETPQIGEVKTNAPTVLKFTNKKLTALQIKKVDAITGAPLPGAKFLVERQNGERIGEYTTDGQGFINIPTLSPDFYVVKEIQSPEGYLLDETPQTVEVETSQPTVVTFSNKPMAGLQILKIDSVTRQPIEGVTFAVSNLNGEKIGEFKTGKDGLIFIASLEPQFYTVTEIKTAEGYQLDSVPKTIEVKWGENAKLEVENKPVASLLIVKTDMRTDKPLEAVKFDVAQINGEKIGT